MGVNPGCSPPGFTNALASGIARSNRNTSTRSVDLQARQLVTLLNIGLVVSRTEVRSKSSALLEDIHGAMHEGCDILFPCNPTVSRTESSTRKERVSLETYDSKMRLGESLTLLPLIQRVQHGVAHRPHFHARGQ